VSLGARFQGFLRKEGRINSAGADQDILGRYWRDLKRRGGWYRLLIQKKTWTRYRERRKSISRRRKTKHGDPGTRRKK